MDENTRFRLKRFLSKECLPGRPQQLTPIERIDATWHLVRDLDISVSELLRNLSPGTAALLREDARELLDDVPEDLLDLGIIIGTGPAVFDSTNPAFIPYSFMLGIAGG